MRNEILQEFVAYLDGVAIFALASSSTDLYLKTTARNLGIQTLRSKIAIC
jgi:hypothetical protein